ncbi:MAG TPA: hypothetical protein VMT03_18855 [Polyangia bacterium]|nr:hypothetical protein [Polyangia bacterium]
MRHVSSLWFPVIVLVGLIGTKVLAWSSLARVRRSIQNFENPQFTSFEFSELPAWVRRRFERLHAAFTGLGFRELVIYKRRSDRLIYTCLLVAADGLTIVHLWVARSFGAHRLTSLLAGWPAFKRELAVAPRYSLVTEFSEVRRFDTTMVEFLARSHVDGKLEFLIVPPEMPLPEVIERHRAGARAFAAKIGAAPLPITSANEFFACERAHMARMAKTLRQRLGG